MRFANAAVLGPSPARGVERSAACSRCRAGCPLAHPAPLPILPVPTPYYTSAEERGAARGRDFSPEPLAPTAYAGQDVVAEEEDTRLLELLRSQVGARLRHGAIQLVQPSDGVDGLP